MAYLKKFFPSIWLLRGGVSCALLFACSGDGGMLKARAHVEVTITESVSNILTYPATVVVTLGRDEWGHATSGDGDSITIPLCEEPLPWILHVDLKKNVRCKEGNLWIKTSLREGVSGSECDPGGMGGDAMGGAAMGGSSSETTSLGLVIADDSLQGWEKGDCGTHSEKFDVKLDLPQ